MELWEKIVEAYPELAENEFAAFETRTGSILLKDDSDGSGAYIAKWEYSKPIPKDLSLGKPSA
jgi:hypothetical protein